MAVSTLWAISLCEVVVLPATLTILKRKAKQEGLSLPGWDQLLQGLFLSQAAAFAVFGLSFVDERALLLLCVGIGSWAVTTSILGHPGIERQGSSHPETSDQVNLDAEQGRQPQASIMVDTVSNILPLHS